MGNPSGGHTSNCRYAVGRSTSPSHFVLVSLAVLSEELHRSTDTPSTATTELRTMCLFRGQSWWRTYNQKVYPSTANRSKNRHAVDFFQSLPLRFSDWEILAEELHRKRGQCTYCALSPFPCSSIIQTPPFPVASRSDHRTPYSRDPPHLLFYSSPSAALTMGFPPPLLS